MELKTISEKFVRTEVYHILMNCGEIFSRHSTHIPRVLEEVQKKIHGAIDESAYHVSQTANTFDIVKKIEHLEIAENEVFFMFNRIEYIVKAKGISIGQANEFILELDKAHTQIVRWLYRMRKMKHESNRYHRVSAYGSRSHNHTMKQSNLRRKAVGHLSRKAG